MSDSDIIALEKSLSEILGGAEKVVVLGCGSELRGDDAAGGETVKRLMNLRSSECLMNQQAAGRFLNLEASKSENVFICNGGTAPENFTGEIKRFQANVLLLIDAADMGLPPGAAALIPTADISGISFSTHKLALKIMTEYLQRETGCRTFILGIQPGGFEFGASLTQEVSRTADKIAIALDKILRNSNCCSSED